MEHSGRLRSFVWIKSERKSIKTGIDKLIKWITYSSMGILPSLLEYYPCSSWFGIRGGLFERSVGCLSGKTSYLGIEVSADGSIRDHIIRVCLQPLPERSAPSLIVWANLPSVLLHLSFPLSNLFIEVSRLLWHQGYKR
jgi:hypothetical protein